MGKHLLINGHGSSDVGAVGNGTNERDFTRNQFTPIVAKYINATAGESAVVYNKSLNMFWETSNGRGMYGYNSNSYTTMTEFHLDAFNGTARYGHVIYASGLVPDNVDKGIAAAIQKYVGVRHGGLNARNNLLQVNVAKQRGINYRLVELGFIDNAADMNNIRRNIEAYAKAVAEAITGKPSGKVVAPKKKAVKKKEAKLTKKKVTPKKPKIAWDWAGTFTANTTIAVRQLKKGQTIPSLTSTLVGKDSYIHKGQWVNWDRLYYIQGYWWVRFKYPTNPSAGYFYMTAGEKQTGVTFGQANSKNRLWGKVSSMKTKEGSTKVTNWNKKGSVK